MPRPPEPHRGGTAGRDVPAGELHRFGRGVRWVHRTVAGLMLVCIGTAAILYNSSLAVLVGNRYLVEQVHVWCGFGLAVPLLLGLTSRAYRGDLGRLNRFTPDDWRWLRSAPRRAGAIAVGKFNAGQKLNAALSGGAIVVLLVSGTVMFLPRVTSLSSRIGATFVHDWTALAVGLLLAGHLTYAMGDAVARRGMRTGYVSVEWAQREHAAWAASVVPQEPPTR